ncbi:MAG: PSD1 and planctomycete cytochrome C domain-containing protein [Planctomycetaceae bacterium]
MRAKHFVCGFVVAIAVVAGPLFAADNGSLPEIVEFNRDIRPILSDNCFFCHGPDKNKRKADLRLDTQEGLHGKDGEPGTVAPGKPSDSELFRRITSSDPEQKMPPPESTKSLTPRDIALIKKWIEQGAKYEGHWAFLPIKRPAESREPKAESRDTVFQSAKVIDQHIHESLTKQNLKPSSAADRVTLIRRLSFDLIGLPPSPEEVESFVKDASPDAYEKLVDRLLKSPHFGERQAMWWLDLVRYADTVGYHGDQNMSVSPFRQYVIESFNSNKRFDQFTIEQLAGDLLPNPTREQLIASGYNRLGMMSAEGGVQDKEYLAKYIAERVRNATGTWLGITLGCAECHDHKFDPLTTRDFYRFEAFFADIQERGLYSGAHADGNWGPFVKVPNAEQEAALTKLDQEIVGIKKVLETTTPELAAAQSAWEKSHVAWTILKPETITSAEGVTLTAKEDGSILASGKNPATDTYTLIVKNPPRGISAFRLEVLLDDSLPKKGPGRAGNGNFVLSEFTVKHVVGETIDEAVALQNGTATYEQTGAAENNPYKKWAVAAAIDGDAKGKTWGWAIMEKVGQPQIAVFETVSDIAGGENSALTISLLQNLDHPQHTIGRFRLSVATSPRPIRADQAPPPNIAALLAIAADQRNDAQKNELAAHFRSITPALDATRKQLVEREAARKELEARVPSTLITASVKPRMVRVLKRGNWMDDSGEEVTPAFPVALTNLRPVEGRLTRHDLARWIVSNDNPLTARVFVNRIWKQLFGAGLSRKLDDLGAQGEWPSHPLVLDHLAASFADNGWDVKQLIKSIVLSNTYQQSSLARRELREADAYNRWLARQGRFRIDAELVRDNALSISGLLVTKLGGTSVKPYQPPGYFAYLNFPAREWQNDSGESLYRRGLYTHWQRQYLHPSLLAFDAPNREECTADRPRSNTPLQSLVLLNDPSYVEASRAFAENILRSGGSTTREKLDWAFRRAVSRPIKPAEAEVLERLLQAHLDEYKSDATAAGELLSVGAKPAPTDLDKPELAAWTSIARTILNLHETITRN